MVRHHNNSGEYARTTLISSCEGDAEVMIAVEVEIDGGEDSRLFALLSSLLSVSFSVWGTRESAVGGGGAEALPLQEM